jgi:hypothetical protein
MACILKTKLQCIWASAQAYYTFFSLSCYDLKKLFGLKLVA